jgi:hypothetical protein
MEDQDQAVTIANFVSSIVAPLINKGCTMTSGTKPSTGQTPSSWKYSARLTAIVFVLLATSRATFAAFVGPNAGSVGGITYNVDTVAAGNGVDPLYGANNDLENISRLPGAGAYGNLFPGPNVLVSNFGGGIAAPVAPLGTLSAFQAGGGAFNGSTFGDTIGGSATVNAKTTGFGSGAGVFWTNPTFLGDAGADGKASVALARGDAIFSDPNGDAAKVPGLALAVSGTLGGQGAAGAFVAASVAGTFTIKNMGGGVVNSFMASIAVVTDGPGAKADIITATSSVPGGVFTPGSSGLGTNSFLAFGSLLLPAVAIPAGGSLELDGTLSFVADPDVTMSLDLFPNTLQLPDIGFEGFAVPEPASIVMMSLGTLATLACCWRCRKTMMG